MLYTFIMEFRGGTYISQIESNSILSACKKWVKKIDVSEIKFFSDAVKAKLLLGMIDTDNKPTKLKGVKNVFFTGVLLGKHMAYIHIVVTDRK